VRLVPNIVNTKTLNWEMAEKLTSEAVHVCAAHGDSVTVTVVASSGQQPVVIKDDTAPLQSPSLSYRKAFTAYAYVLAFNRNSTSEFVATKLTEPTDGVALASVPQVLFVAGGVTLRVADHTAIREIGFSGGPGCDQDEACAQAVADKYQGEFH
jgi:uncharacterized protein GlcG (DUF336 family)